MASTDISHFTKNQSSEVKQEANQEDHKLEEECKELILSLPREKGLTTPYVYQFQGFWFPSNLIQPIITFQNHFQAKDTDVVIASLPKAGTTWLKALTFATVNRHNFPASLENHPLLTSNPHTLVPTFESSIYGDKTSQLPSPTMDIERKLFATHVPFTSLANSIKENSKCKIIYICRNPFDNFVSFWIFLNKVMPESFPAITLEDAFEKFCDGTIVFGPFGDHVLGYWKESVARPDNILFLKYEDLKQDINFHVKRVAEFLGCPFTFEEESGGMIENIVKLCSFENMKELEVNKSGLVGMNVENKYFFRKGEVGDSMNYLSPSMVEKLSKTIEEKLSGSGLSFEASLPVVT